MREHHNSGHLILIMRAIGSHQISSPKIEMGVRELETVQPSLVGHRPWEGDWSYSACFKKSLQDVKNRKDIIYI